MLERPKIPMFDIVPPAGGGKGLRPEEQKESADQPSGHPEEPLFKEAAAEERAPDLFLQKLASEKKRIPPLGEPTFRPRILRFLAISVVGAVLLFGSAWGIGATFSRATITLIADRAFSPFSFEVELGTAVEAPNWTARRLPLQALRKTIEQQKEYSATGQGEVFANARGMVTLQNALPSSQLLVARTRLQSPDGKIFRLAAPARIPANGSIQAEVIADKPGADYNIGPARFTIPAFREQGLTERYARIYAESQETFRGGASGQAVLVRQEDIRSAKEQLSSEALDALSRDIREAVPEGFVLLDQGAMRLSVNNISADAKIGDARERFAVTLEAMVEALVFDERHILELARREADNTELLEALPNAVFDFAYTPARPADFTNGTLALRIDGSLNVARSVNIEEIKQALAGESETAVQRELLAIPGIREARLALWPFWMRRVPQSAERIEIQIE